MFKRQALILNFGGFLNKMQELWWKDAWAYMLTFSSGSWVKDARFAWQLVGSIQTWIFCPSGSWKTSSEPLTTFSKSLSPFSEHTKICNSGIEPLWSFFSIWIYICKDVPTEGPLWPAENISGASRQSISRGCSGDQSTSTGSKGSHQWKQTFSIFSSSDNTCLQNPVFKKKKQKPKQIIVISL